MQEWSSRAGLVATAVLLAGCAMTGGGGEARRPPVSVADEVTAVQRDMLLGTWRCRELNPYPGVPKASRTITFDKDGTVVAEMLTEDDPRYGAIQGTSRGLWSVEGDRLVMDKMKLEAKAAEGNTDPFTGVLTGLTTTIANTLMRDQQASTSEVLKLSRHELVFRTVVADPPVVACTRRSANGNGGQGGRERRRASPAPGTRSPPRRRVASASATRRHSSPAPVASRPLRP